MNAAQRIAVARLAARDPRPAAGAFDLLCALFKVAATVCVLAMAVAILVAAHRALRTKLGPPPDFRSLISDP